METITAKDLTALSQKGDKTCADVISRAGQAETSPSELLKFRVSFMRNHVSRECLEENSAFSEEFKNMFGWGNAMEASIRKDFVKFVEAKEVLMNRVFGRGRTIRLAL